MHIQTTASEILLYFALISVFHHSMKEGVSEYLETKCHGATY